MASILGRPYLCISRVGISQWFLPISHNRWSQWSGLRMNLFPLRHKDFIFPVFSPCFLTASENLQHCSGSNSVWCFFPLDFKYMHFFSCGHYFLMYPDTDGYIPTSHLSRKGLHTLGFLACWFLFLLNLIVSGKAIPFKSPQMFLLTE